MSPGSERPHADAQSFTDAELAVYEAIATCEQSGRPPTAAEIAAASGLGEATVAEAVQAMTGRGVLLADEATGAARYALARHDWSVAQDKPDVPGQLGRR
jgi:DNA-binding IclR family transcriptional regulator